NKAQQNQYLSDSFIKTNGPTKVDTFFKYGTRLGVSIALPYLFVSTRPFTSGFITNSDPNNPTYIRDDNGEKIIEYFAMRLQTDLALTANQSGSYYALALLSDDGAVVSNRTTGELLVDNDYTHPTRLGCGTKAIYLKPGEKLPLRIDYYQGPRQHIALVLLWKKLSSPNFAADPLCGHEGNSEFFGSNYKDFSNGSRYGQLMERGWEVVPTTNLNTVIN
ncbi:MAG: hypothetical protein KDD22_05975, partial [Bdellovibrionales bacterium]|nr:hypothetical protein [Bdellovibrionales bacterium]